MKPEEVKALKEQLAAMQSELSEVKKKANFEIDTQPIQRPTIIGPMVKVYESDAPLYTYLSGQAIPVAPLSLNNLYKVIDDLGPVFETDGQTGSVPDQSASCADRLSVNFCQRDFQAFRVAVEACVDEQNVDVPFVAGRDAQGSVDGVNTVGDYRDVKAGEGMRQAKDFLLAQGLGNASNEPESLETLINQNTTPNVIDNVGISAFEFSLMALLAQIGMTTLSHSFIRNDGDMTFITHPLVELTMSRRAALPGLEEMYNYDVTSGVVRFMGIPVIADRNINVDSTTLMTSIFLVRRNHIGVIETMDTDKEIKINEENSPASGCEEDCTRLYNRMTGLSRGVAKMGRVINVRPMLVNTIVSGLTDNLNNPNAGTTLGGTPQ